MEPQQPPSPGDFTFLSSEARIAGDLIHIKWQKIRLRPEILAYLIEKAGDQVEEILLTAVPRELWKAGEIGGIRVPSALAHAMRGGIALAVEVPGPAPRMLEAYGTVIETGAEVVMTVEVMPKPAVFILQHVAEDAEAPGA